MDKTANFSKKVSLKPICATAKSDIFMHNPDRGFRVHNVLRVWELTPFVDDKQKLMEEVAIRFNNYFQGVKEPCHLSFCYIYLTAWVREDLPEEALEVVRAIFQYARSIKYKLYVSFAYNNKYLTAWYDTEGLMPLMEKVCADEPTILRHIDQLAPIISEYKDCCFTIKNGFIGFVGEWAYPYQYPEVDYDKITMAIVDKLCVPNGLYFSHRLPRYTESVRKNYPEWENIKWIGFNNCAFYGEQKNPGWSSEGFQLDDEEGWWEYICQRGAHVPITGEMFTSYNLNQRNIMIKGKDAILELAHHWHVTFSFFHGKYDAAKEHIKVIGTWEEQEVDAEWLDANGIIYDPNWFLDDKGNTVPRNCYDFIRDHLGYKLVAETLSADEKDGKIAVSMDFKNYGFSVAFNLESSFAVLDENYEVVSEIKAGEPTKWYSHDPKNWRSNVILNHNVSAELTTPENSGKYYLAFSLRNTMGMGARLSNDVEFKNGYNVLFDFTV